MKLLEEISKCEVCKPFLQLGPRPVLSIHEKSKIAIIGQAPEKLYIYQESLGMTKVEKT
jgi:uracil-DNA glycosylase